MKCQQETRERNVGPSILTVAYMDEDISSKVEAAWNNVVFTLREFLSFRLIFFA